MIKEKALASSVSNDASSTIPLKRQLLTYAPVVAKEWHPTKNGPLTPSMVSYGTMLMVWWLCPTCQNDWEAPVNRRAIKQSGCPYCSGKKIKVGFNDLTTTAPEVAKEWHPTKNAPLQPTEVFRGSNKEVWWECQNGHEWQALIMNRTSGKSQCPICYQRSRKKSVK